MQKKIVFYLVVLCALLVLGLSYLVYDSRQENVSESARAQSGELEERQEQREKDRALRNAKENTDIILPEKLYALQSVDDPSYSLNIFSRSVIEGSLDEINIDLVGESVKEYEEHWEIKPNSKGFEDSNSIDVTLSDDAGNELKSVETQVELVPISKKDSVNLLSIGDSMTRQNLYGKRVQDLLPNVQTVGTRTFDGGVSNGEGRGGWRLNDYMEKIGHESGEDSPFLFPEETPGNLYFGNTSFWKNVCYEDPSEYKYDGFQKIASGWIGSECNYDKKGYPKNPSENSVVVDPEQPMGEQFLEYQGSEWKVMDPQPEIEFNFSKYMKRNENVFVDSEPNMVSILFGANDFQTTSGLPGIESFISDVNEVRSSISAYDPSIKFIISLPIVGNNQEVWETREGTVPGSAEQYRRNMQNLGRVLIEEFDSKEEEGVYISATNIGVGIENMQDWVHPNESGYNRMGDVLAGLIQKIR